MSVSHFVIGTAGHIDHGKTELVKALTGTDTDRLLEEKRRGISIEIGFASFFLPEGLEVSIVDLPGHERFVKNMLAGSTGIDLLLLVVAADDGVMAQTIEHLAIAELLDVRVAVVAITKIDMVDEDRLQEVETEVSELLEKSIFIKAPVVKVSAKTKVGLDNLVTAIEDETGNISERPIDLPPRIPIDRSFTIKGSGRVITGTLWSGVLTTSGPLELLPSGKNVRPRKIEVRGQKVSKALAGQRVAINIVITGEPPRRGDVLVAPATFALVDEIIAQVKVLPSASAALGKRKRLRLFHGTKEVAATLTPITGRQIVPGQTAYARIHLSEPVPAVFRDHFILRSLSPVTTIGGGTILRVLFKRRPIDLSISHLDALASGDDGCVVEEFLKAQKGPIASEDLSLNAQIGMEKIESVLELLVSEERAVKIDSWRRTYYVGVEAMAKSGQALQVFLADFHQSTPYQFGVAKEKVRMSIWPELSSSQADILLDYFVSDGLVFAKEGEVALAERVKEDPTAAVIETVLEKINNFSPPGFANLAKELETSEHDLKALLNRAQSEGRAVQVSKELWFSAAAISEAKDRLIDYLAGAGEITISKFKEILGTTRKFAVPLAEYFDKEAVTRRDGDVRVPYKN